MDFCCNEQLGGAASISFYLLTETSNWPLVLTDTNSSQIVFTPEENNITGNIKDNSISIKDTPRQGPYGDQWPIDLRFVYLTRGEAMEQLLEQYANLPGVAIVCLNDGTKKVYGTNKQPLYLRWENDYGEKMDDNHGVIIRITGEMMQRPVFYHPPED